MLRFPGSEHLMLITEIAGNTVSVFTAPPHLGLSAVHGSEHVVLWNCLSGTVILVYSFEIYQLVLNYIY